MTKEEMKANITQAHIDGYNRGYAKAKDKIADIKANCDLAIEGRDVKIKELEKVNAELKEKIEVLECDNYNANCNLNLITDQLTKAKELLTKWVELFKPKGGNIPPTPIQVDTEQFLKEKEKK